MKEIRELIATQSGKFDTSYTLVRNEEGLVYVETFHSPHEPHLGGSTGPTIFPADFDKHVIHGTPLRARVNALLKKLNRVKKRPVGARGQPMRTERGTRSY